jgi:hypothetical protein
MNIKERGMEESISEGLEEEEIIQSLKGEEEDMIQSSMQEEADTVKSQEE